MPSDETHRVHEKRRLAEPFDPVILQPNAVYFSDQVRRLFRLKESTLAREIRKGRLRVAKRAGRHFYLGRWLLDWIESGELKPRQTMPEASS